MDWTLKFQQQVSKYSLFRLFTRAALVSPKFVGGLPGGVTGYK